MRPSLTRNSHESSKSSFRRLSFIVIVIIIIIIIIIIAEILVEFTMIHIECIDTSFAYPGDVRLKRLCAL